MSNTGMARKLVVEAIGPFALVFLGAGSIISTQFTGGDSGVVNLVAIALAHGLAIAVMAAAVGHISGGHFNPAVTIGLLVGKKTDLSTAIAYIIAQLVGATLGAGALTLVFKDIDRNAANLGLPAIRDGYSIGNGLAIEAIMTFFLMFVIFGVAVDKRGAGIIAPLAIGLTISIDIMMGGPVSGAAMNPARHFGPMIIQQDWTNLWVYWVGPIAGAIVAALIYTRVVAPDLDDAGDEAPAVAVAAPRAESAPAAATPAERSRRSQRRKR
jgi:MIP family channel proteins